jgi:hypothetical protein
MLPEFAKAHRVMNDLWNHAMFAGLNGTDALLSEIPVRVQREGNAAFIGGGEMEYKTCSVEFSITARNAEGMTRDEFLGTPFKVGAEMAAKQVQNVFESIKESSAHTTMFSWEPGKLTLDVLLEAWSSMEVQFGEDGKPEWPTAVMAPESITEIQQMMPKWLEDPECRRKWGELTERKRKEFDEREARRRLVD